MNLVEYYPIVRLCQPRVYARCMTVEQLNRGFVYGSGKLKESIIETLIDLERKPIMYIG